MQIRLKPAENRKFLLLAEMVVVALTAMPCYAQQVRSGLGNSTVIEPVNGADPYGINRVNSAVAGDVMATRHRPTGQGSGIGGSYMGTTSVTSETRPVGEPVLVQPVRTPTIEHGSGFSVPGKNLFSQSMMSSPATSNPSNMPAFPVMTATDALNQSTGLKGEQPDLSLLMKQVSKHYELTVDQPLQLWDNSPLWK
jgi:hypothetical protein